MKRVITGILLLVLVTLSLGGCGGSSGPANNPIGVVDSVKVGMTHAQVLEVVDLKYFQDNESYWTCLIDGVEIEGKNFTFRYSQDEDALWYGMLYFSVESKTLKPALVILRWPDDGPAIINARVVAVGAISFDYGQMIVEEESGKPFRR